MKVLEDKKTPWSLKMDCKSCGSKLEIRSEDITSWRWAYFDESGLDFQVECVACKQTMTLPESKLPAWVQTEALKRKDVTP